MDRSDTLCPRLLVDGMGEVAGRTFEAACRAAGHGSARGRPCTARRSAWNLRPPALSRRHRPWCERGMWRSVWRRDDPLEFSGAPAPAGLTAAAVDLHDARTLLREKRGEHRGGSSQGARGRLAAPCAAQPQLARPLLDELEVEQAS